MRARLGWWLLGLGLAATAWPALRGGDRVASEAIFQAAMKEAGDDPSASIWVDVVRVQLQLAPWQAGHAEARARLHTVTRMRRAALPHDRGGRRVPVGPEAVGP